jgi:putative transcriptional regulator
MTPLEIRELRKSLNLSQHKFAKRYHIEVGTFLRWERGRSVPTGTGLALLELIRKAPQTIATLFAQIPQAGGKIAPPSDRP